MVFLAVMGESQALDQGPTQPRILPGDGVHTEGLPGARQGHLQPPLGTSGGEAAQAPGEHDSAPDVCPSPAESPPTAQPELPFPGQHFLGGLPGPSAQIGPWNRTSQDTHPLP